MGKIQEHFEAILKFNGHISALHTHKTQDTSTTHTHQLTKETLTPHSFEIGSVLQKRGAVSGNFNTLPPTLPITRLPSHVHTHTHTQTHTH